MELAPLFLGTFAIGTDLFIVVPLLPAIRRDFPSASVSDLGQFLVGAYAPTHALLGRPWDRSRTVSAACRS